MAVAKVNPVRTLEGRRVVPAPRIHTTLGRFIVHDCLPVLSQMESNSVDLFITSPIRRPAEVRRWRAIRTGVVCQHLPGRHR